MEFNLSDKLHSVVYVPKYIVPPIIYPLDISLYEYLESSAHVDFSENKYTPANSFIRTGNDLLSSELLERNEDCYLLSQTELLELKKKWCSDGFNEGHESRAKNTTVYNTEFGVNAKIDQNKISKDKTQYINNLTLD